MYTNTPILNAHLQGIRTRRDYENFQRNVQAELNIVHAGINENIAPQRDRNFNNMHPRGVNNQTPVGRGHYAHNFHNFQENSMPSMDWDDAGHLQRPTGGNCRGRGRGRGNDFRPPAGLMDPNLLTRRDGSDRASHERFHPAGDRDHFNVFEDPRQSVFYSGHGAAGRGAGGNNHGNFNNGFGLHSEQNQYMPQGDGDHAPPSEYFARGPPMDPGHRDGGDEPNVPPRFQEYSREGNFRGGNQSGRQNGHSTRRTGGRTHTEGEGNPMHSTMLDSADEEMMDRVYNIYGAPLDARTYAHPSGRLHSTSVAPRGRSAAYGDPNMRWQFSGPEIKLPHFSGDYNEYSDWKTAFRSRVDSYPEGLQASVLKDHLDSLSKQRVAFISSSSTFAYNSIWEELDLWDNLGVPSHQVYTGQLTKLVSGPPAKDYKGLENIYTTLKSAWYKLCNLGPRYSGYAEPILSSIGNILFGSSQKRVDKLSCSGNLKVPEVLNAIWEHMRMMRARDQSVANFEVSRPNSNTKSHASLHATSFVPHKGSPLKTTHGANAPRSRSPSPAKTWFYKCSLCQVNDHSHLDCTRFSPTEVFELCTTRGLCFVCRMRGHRAEVCPHTSLRCLKEACLKKAPHCDLFCKF